MTDSQITRREAEMVETMARIGGPVTASGLASAMILNADKPSRSTIARITQSLLNLERDGIVVRGGAGKRCDWRLKA